MENPVAEIPHVIHLLTQSAPSLQRATIERYFTPDASFTHPFCRTGSFHGSRWLIWNIYRWYKIMSPRIDIAVDSVAALRAPTAFDAHSLRLYVSIHQVFQPWAIPGLRVRVRLVTELQLVATPPAEAHAPRCYRIAAQNDLYQVNEFVKFVSVLRVLWLAVLGWQFAATGFCVLGALLLAPVSWVEENVVGGNEERGVRAVVLGEGGKWVAEEGGGSVLDGEEGGE
ncbi:hypothetical protein MMC26_003980 [Xylographa opegraphella]|nr:hypothetical protein [Xylographa opegraphella]